VTEEAVSSSAAGPLHDETNPKESTLTITDPTNSAVPDLNDAKTSPESLAMIGVAQWLRGDQAAAAEHDEAMRAATHREEMQRRMEAAANALAGARARVSNLMDKVDLEGRRIFGFGVGTVVIGALTALDVIPLNWAAQAFGLNAAASWVVTMILLAASVGAMAGLEVTRHDARRRTALVAILLTAYAGLVGLRTSFLVTVDGESFLAALLQALVLSAISAALVVLGSAVMTRTRSLRLSRARAAAQRARRVSEASVGAWRQADDKFGRHLGVLRRHMVRQPLYSSVPAGVAHAAWVAALEQALRAQFTTRW
jgi:hypothetical protein